MPNKAKPPNPADRQKLILPGYPPYSSSEDIYNQDEQEMDIDLDELLRDKTPKRMAQKGKNQNKIKIMQHNIHTTSAQPAFPGTFAMKNLLFSAFALMAMQAPLSAQEVSFTQPSWWFGEAAAANLNYYRGTTQRLNAGFTAPVAFDKGFGAGVYVAPLIEFHRPNSWLGLILQAGYDGRSGTFTEQISACNCPADLVTNLNYITVEPSLRLAPFKSNFYLYGGPRFAFSLDKAFTYKQKVNLDVPSTIDVPDVKGDFSDVNKTLISMQIGAGYDIPLTAAGKQTQMMLSPFVSFQPYWGQAPRSVETWSVANLRVGAAFKFGVGRKISVPATEDVTDAQVRFSVISPKNIPVERRVRETFPLLNYVFFNIGSTEIPEGYVLLGKAQVKDFKEDQLEVFAPKRLSGRSNREMAVYYNILNIIGDRLGKNPSSTITLVGSSEKGPEDGKAMAESIKRYLVEIFGINASRIAIEGRDKPKIPSEQPGATQELKLLREGDRRVSIESGSPALLMEFQSGPEASLKPVEINAVQQAPLDSYVVFNVEGAEVAFSSWSLDIRDEKGKVQSFGPYTREQVRIPGKYILGARSEGDYKVTMTGLTKNGKTVKREMPVHMVLWTPPQNEQGMRYSVVYEFNASNTMVKYEKYLTDVVTPKIPLNATVIIHGYTDIIGDAAYNQKLSLARANDVKRIFENSLAAAGRKDVRLEVFGFGEDETLSPFENNFPEERFYNRTVLIDIIPRR